MTSPFDHAIHRSEHFLLGAQARMASFDFTSLALRYAQDERK